MDKREYHRNYYLQNRSRLLNRAKTRYRAISTLNLKCTSQVYTYQKDKPFIVSRFEPEYLDDFDKRRAELLKDKSHIKKVKKITVSFD
jgi:hypothetical protein